MTGTIALVLAYTFLAFCGLTWLSTAINRNANPDENNDTTGDKP